jgi:hypothetical protein
VNSVLSLPLQNSCICIGLSSFFQNVRVNEEYLSTVPFATGSVLFLGFFFLLCTGWFRGRRRDSPVRGAGYEPFDSILRIEVRRALRSQFDPVRTMLERCVGRKADRAEFSPTRQHPPNSHNRPTKKINDMSMSVRDGKISSEIVVLSVTTSGRRICDPSIASVY